MKDKNKNCPKCGMLMKYKGSHLFYCKNDKTLWKLLRNDYHAIKKKESDGKGGLITTFIKKLIPSHHKYEGWYIIYD